MSRLFIILGVEFSEPFTPFTSYYQCHQCLRIYLDRHAICLVLEKPHVMTRSDIVNHNTPHHPSDSTKFSSSMPPNFEWQYNSDGRITKEFELEAIAKEKSRAEECDLMNVSLTSYELLDYTLQNLQTSHDGGGTDQMHVSMSEEVNEQLRVEQEQEQVAEPPEEEKEPPPPPVDEQIVFRRQRRRKSKSETPKKRVSFHEDILNSTKVDDVHINHGFVTHEPEFPFSFFDRHLR